MSKTCIVCLEDLGEDPNAPTPTVPLNSDNDAEASDGSRQSSSGSKAPQKSVEIPENGLIAHLLPCGHNLHDECLKPWVERANSCPICRQSFNMVELFRTLDSPVISTYTVSDKKQEEEIDPAMYIDDIDDPESRPCPMCTMSDNEDVMILCDSCETGYHTYCVDLPEVPRGSWYCGECTVNGAIALGMTNFPSPRARLSGPRTREQQRAFRFHLQASNASDWARVWRSVWDHLDMDLDFPYEDDAASAQYRRNQVSSGRRRGGRRFRAWERRLEIAQQQGAGERFEDSADQILDRPILSRPRPDLPEPESAEEILAWNALEKARDIDADPSPKPRIRKSASTSPSDKLPTRQRRKRKRSTSQTLDESVQAPIPERRFKRPQTRRTNDLQTSDVAESSSARPSELPEDAPSFLQSLLNEVKASTPQEEKHTSCRPSLILNHLNSHPPSDYPSPQYSSPAASPTVSNHPSPRPLSASPPPMNRPGSPVPLTSNIVPIYPPAPDLSKEFSPSSGNRTYRSSKSQTRVGRWAIETAQSSSPQRPRSEEASPTRSIMSLSTKETLQRFVKNALKPPYHANQITKEQYTDVNRKVSHILYDLVGEDGEVNEANEESLRRTASEEVTKALQALHESSSSE